MAESKFVENPSAFIPHILKPNRPALEALITKPEVERKLLLRLRKKALVYAQGFAPDGEPLGEAVKIEVDGVVELYESYIIPLTREVEVRTSFCLTCLMKCGILTVSQVDYLLARLEGLSQEQIDALLTKKQ